MLPIKEGKYNDFFTGEKSLTFQSAESGDFIS